MFNYPTANLVHLHGDERYPMTERPHDPTQLDPERGWLQGARVFRCSACDETIVLLPQGGDLPSEEAGSGESA